MENLIRPRLHSQLIDAGGTMLQLSPGKYRIRSHVPLSLQMDGAPLLVEANVETEFTTTSGAVQVFPRPAPTAIELFPLPPDEAPATPAAENETAAAEAPKNE